MADKSESLPTQQFIDVDEIQNGVLIMRGGALRQIVAVSGVNFDLKSEDEQNAITFGYQNFLNSLNFTLQLMVHSRKVNVSNYIENLKKIEAAEQSPLLKTQIAEYREFIGGFVAQNAIMQKHFFAVVPYDVIEIGGVSSAGGIGGFFKKKSSEAADAATSSVEETRARSMSQLSQRVDQVVTGFTQLGMRCTLLGDQEVTELLYHLYNPDAEGNKPITKENEKQNVQ